TQQWNKLEQAGSDVIVILDNPGPIGSVYECLQGHLEDLGACAFPRSEGIARSAQSVQLDAAEEVGTVDVVDLTESICPAPMCVPEIGNVLIYRQGSHLTDTYVRTLTEALGRQLVPLVAQPRHYPDTQTGCCALTPRPAPHPWGGWNDPSPAAGWRSCIAGTPARPCRTRGRPRCPRRPPGRRPRPDRPN